MTSNFDINEVEEIQVRYVGGDEIIYKGLGLEKIRRLICSSPHLEMPKKSIVVDDLESPDMTPRRNKINDTVNSARGYASTNLDYKAASKGKSAVDIAKEMQRKAEEGSGIKFH